MSEKHEVEGSMQKTFESYGLFLFFGRESFYTFENMNFDIVSNFEFRTLDFRFIRVRK